MFQWSENVGQLHQCDKNSAPTYLSTRETMSNHTMVYLDLPFSLFLKIKTLQCQINKGHHIHASSKFAFKICGGIKKESRVND
jgi:hypothetical protein